MRPLRREIIHYHRVGDRIDTRIVTASEIELDPPGITLALDEIYAT